MKDGSSAYYVDVEAGQIGENGQLRKGMASLALMIIPISLLIFFIIIVAVVLGLIPVYLSSSE